MFMKIANARKNNKGFSLVELIIVIAIMVALVAVMAPQFVKYVQKSRDAALTSAAEDYLSAIKTAYSDQDLALVLPTSSKTITISVVSGYLKVNNDSSLDTTDFNKLNSAAGVKGDGATEKMGQTSVKYVITITSTGNISMSAGKVSAS